MKKKIFLYLFLLLQVSLNSFAQEGKNNSENSPAIDSLLNLLEKTKGNFQKINIQNALSKQYTNIGNYEEAMQYANEAIALINKTNFNLPKENSGKELLADSYNNLGIIHEHQGRSTEAMEWYSKSIKLYENSCGQSSVASSTGETSTLSEKKCRKGLAASYNHVGRVLADQGNNDESLVWFSKSLKIMEEINDQEGMANAYGNIGIAHNDKGNAAFERGDLKTMEKEYLEAFNWYSKTLKIEQEIKDTRGIVISYTNIGFLLSDVYQKDTNAVVLIDKKNIDRHALLDSALACQTRGYSLAKKMMDKPGMTYSLIGIGRIYILKKQFNLAYSEFQDALKLAKEIGEVMPQVDAQFGFYESLKGLGRYKEALENFEKHVSLRDTLESEDKLKKSLGQHYEYQYEKKTQALQLEQEKKDAIANAEKQREKLILNSFIGGFVLILILAIVVLRGYRSKQKTNYVLETLNKELEKYSLVASETDNGVLICGPNGEIEWSNAGMTRLLGYSFEELKQRGNTIEELSSNPDIKMVIHQSIENKKSSTYEVLNIMKNGTERWIQSTLTPILDKSGKLKKLVVIDTDISERKKIEEKLSEQNLELEQSHKDISILSEIGQEITSSLSVERIIEKTYENVNKLMEAAVFCIGIINLKNHRIDFPGLIEKGKKYNSSFDLDDDNRFSVLCYKNRQEILINDLQKEYKQYVSYIAPPIVGEHAESLIYLPLISNEKVIGVINVESFHKNAYTNHHLNILKNLAVYIAIAIENAQLYENLEEKVEERTIELVKRKEEIEKTYNNIQVLSEIGQEITSTLNIEKVLDTVYEKVNSLMDATEFGIGIYHDELHSLDFSNYYFESKRMAADLDTWVSMEDKNRLSVWCAENKKVVFINDMQNEYADYISNLDSYLGEGKLLLESLICIPLIVEKKLVGLISVQSPNKNAYTQNHLEILQTLASYIAIALDNARLYNKMVIGKEEIEKTYNNIQVLSEIGQEITSTLNLEKVLDTVYEKVNSLMDATEFGIGIFNPQKQSIDFSYYYYESKRMSADLDTWVSMEDKNRLSVWCVENKKPVFINDIENEYANYISNLDSYKGEGKLLLKSIICLPLVIEEKLVGLISVQSPKKNTYTQNHLEILQTLASYVAIALDNARLYDNMEGEIKERTKEIEKQKHLLEEKNLKITDSIYYAQRIQQAILPSQKMISSILPDSFIFFRPKDIVSGDFYWAHAIDKHQVLFAAVDCTGHGVPGALMSIMGYNLLEQIVKENKIYQPALILDELSKLVVNTLKQTDEVGSIKEGMDIALCKINYKTSELEYAGAHNSLNLIRNGILTETKANQRSIGLASANSLEFYNHKIKLEKGDNFYIFSDGYADQFGGNGHQKFFYKPFRELLLEIHHLSMEDQQQKLEKVIIEWKGKREQTDDILIIGVRV